MKTLVILAHPNLENSRVNQRWKEELLQYPNDITIHEIYKEYPDWNIDVPREQNLMEAYDHVIFQFPLYWYSYPPLLKKWFDEVIAPFKASAKHIGAEALPYFAVFGASFQASDEEINTSAKDYINYIFKYHS
jgi:putative NADPH-quinone reductase